MDRGKALPRLLKALAVAALRRLAGAYRLGLKPGASRARLIRRLLARPEVDADEVVQHLLRHDELALVCKRLSLHDGGTWGQLAQRLRHALRWRPFAEARAFARGLGLTSQSDWFRFCRAERPGRHSRLPPDVPAYPSKRYQAAWVDWYDWLGTEDKRRVPWRPFQEARRLVRSLRLRSGNEWKKFCRGELKNAKGLRPRDIPVNPGLVYAKQGWVSSGDFLGTFYVAPRLREYRSLEAARRFARKLGLGGAKEWQRYCKGQLRGKGRLPKDIPSTPDRAYREDGWVSWGDWLGTGLVATTRKTFLPFVEARRFARSLGLRSFDEWRAYLRNERPELGKRPQNVPGQPRGAYLHTGWVSWGDWLGTGNVANDRRPFPPFRKARAIVRRLGLKATKEWWEWRRGERRDLPPPRKDLPANPYILYPTEWLGWRDWLGTGPPTSERLPFHEARAIAQRLGLRTVREWRAWRRGELAGRPPAPDGLPANPDRAYAKEWRGWSDWLGGPRPRGTA